MAPPPSSAAEVRSPCWRRAIHRTKGQCWRHISPGPAGRSLSRQLRRQPIREPSRTQARLTVLPLPTTRWRIVTDHPSLYHSLRSAGAISLPPHTPCRLGAGRDCAEGGADGTQIVLFGVPGDCGSGVPGSACTSPATGELRLGPSCVQRTTLAFLSRRLGTPRTVAYRV